MYLGPLLAGLAGHGWPVLPVFAAVFLLWQVLMRPAVFPPSPAAWARRGVRRNALLTAATQAALVAALLAVGRGLGGVLWAQPSVPDLLPPALSLAAVAVARAVALAPRREVEVATFLDRAVAEIDGRGVATAIAPGLLGRAGSGGDAARAARLEALLAVLELRVAAGVPLAGPEIDALARVGPPEDVWAELSARAQRGAPWQRLRLAFLAHAGVRARTLHEDAVAGALEDAFGLGDPALDREALAAARAWIAGEGVWIDDAQEDAGGRGAALAAFLAAVDAAAAAQRAA